MTPEHKLFNEVRLWCGEHDYIVIRQQSGTFYTKQGIPVKIGFDGLSDCIIFGHGKCYFCELKVRPNKPSNAQLEFIELMKKRGFEAMVVYSLEDLKKLLNI